MDGRIYADVCAASNELASTSAGRMMCGWDCRMMPVICRNDIVVIWCTTVQFVLCLLCRGQVSKSIPLNGECNRSTVLTEARHARTGNCS